MISTQLPHNLSWTPTQGILFHVHPWVTWGFSTVSLDILINCLLVFAFRAIFLITAWFLPPEAPVTPQSSFIGYFCLGCSWFRIIVAVNVADQAFAAYLPPFYWSNLSWLRILWQISHFISSWSFPFPDFLFCFASMLPFYTPMTAGLKVLHFF